MTWVGHWWDVPHLNNMHNLQDLLDVGGNCKTLQSYSTGGQICGGGGTARDKWDLWEGHVWCHYEI